MDDGTGTAKLHPAHHHRRLLPGTLDPRIPHGHQPRHHLRIHLLLGLALGPGRRTAGRPPDDRNPGDPKANPETTPRLQSDCSISRLKHNCSAQPAPTIRRMGAQAKLITLPDTKPDLSYAQ